MTPDQFISTNKRSIRTLITIASGEKLYTQSIKNIAFNIDGQTIRIKDVL